MIINHDLDLKDNILSMEAVEISSNNFTVDQTHSKLTILIGGYRHYFYDNEEDCTHDFKIIERYVRLNNIKWQ